MKTEKLIKNLENHISTLDIVKDRKTIRFIRRSIIALKDREKDLDEVSRETPELTNGTYYLALTIEGKWGIALWKSDKWWSDENQDDRLSFGIKDDFIKAYYNLPSKQEQPC